MGNTGRKSNRQVIQEITIGKKKKPYLDVSICLICQAIDSKTQKPLRLDIDKYYSTHGLKETKRYVDEDLKIGGNTNYWLKRHFNEHSTYLTDVRADIEKAVQKVGMQRIEKLAEAFIDADEVIQDIINEGGKKIREGEIEVDSKLLLGALKEQGQRKKTGTLHDIFKELDRARFIEGQVVEPEQLPDGPESTS